MTNSHGAIERCLALRATAARMSMWYLIVFTLVALLGCDPPGHKFSTSQWKSHQIPDATFRISFPEDPHRDSTALSTRLGDVVTHKLSASSGDGSYLISWSVHPDSLFPPESLEVVSWRRMNGAINAVSAYLHGQVVHQDTLACQGYIGYELASKANFEGQEVNLLAQFYMVDGTRFYQLIMVASDLTTKKNEMVEFFGSFEIDELQMPPLQTNAWDEVFK